MLALGSTELIFLAVIHIPTYLVHRHNKKQNKPPKVWAAVLLSFFPSPVGGILYVSGIFLTLIVFFLLVALVVVVDLVASSNFIGGPVLAMPIIAGYLASKKRVMYDGQAKTEQS